MSGPVPAPPPPPPSPPPGMAAAVTALVDQQSAAMRDLTPYIARLSSQFVAELVLSGCHPMAILPMATAYQSFLMGRWW